ncbi:MAG: sugar ABC transporter ATP-binding protein [Gemmatimonadaceae bacterium]
MIPFTGGVMAGGGSACLDLCGLSKRFGATVALDGVDLSVRPGEVHAVIGENGAGKSTLMAIIAGALRADRGEMRLADRPYAPASPLDARVAGVALIHQEPALCPQLSVTENVLLGVESARWGWVDRRRSRDRATELLDHFHHPAIHPDRVVGELPLAARQVVEICRALAADARVVLMDEPTSSLPRSEADRLFALVRRLAAQGICVVYISHFLEEVREIAQRYTLLRDGRSIEAGTIASVTNEHLIQQMVGRRVDHLFGHRPGRGTGGDVLLDVRGLRAPPALQEASFVLRRGEILGVAGLVGSGRTELVRALFGLGVGAAGECRVRGTPSPVGSVSASERLDQGFGYLSEDRKGEGLALQMSIADNITLPRLSACASHWGWIDPPRQREQAARATHGLEIKLGAWGQSVGSLSGGNQQKVAIARLLHQKAQILLLDEPTRGVDVGSKAQIYQMIAACAGAGKGVLLVSSYLPELFGLCHRLAVMCRGTLSPARPISDWTPESVMTAAVGSLGTESDRPQGARSMRDATRHPSPHTPGPP